MLRLIYLSPAGRLISLLLGLLAIFHRPFMVYGTKDRVSGRFRKRTRISSIAAINDKDRLSLGDHVWIGHYCVVDGSGGVTLGDGVQLASGVMIFSHGSQDAIRLYGRMFIETPAVERIGYTRAEVVVGEYSFIGAGTIILAGTRLGRGCLVGAGSLVSGVFPDFAIIQGVPATVVGDVRDRDAPFFDHPSVRDHYFDRETITARDRADHARLG